MGVIKHTCALTKKEALLDRFPGHEPLPYFFEVFLKIKEVAGGIIVPAFNVAGLLLDNKLNSFVYMREDKSRVRVFRHGIWGLKGLQERD